MKEVEIKFPRDIDAVLREIDAEATKAVKEHRKYLVSYGATDKAYTAKQRGALHVWCNMCAKVLNDNGLEREVVHPFTKETYSMPWTGGAFKEDIYKFVLAAMTGKRSTEDQTTVNPSEVAIVISKRYAENGLICPPWPSVR